MPINPLTGLFDPYGDAGGEQVRFDGQKPSFESAIAAPNPYDPQSLQGLDYTIGTIGSAKGNDEHPGTVGTGDVAQSMDLKKWLEYYGVSNFKDLPEQVQLEFKSKWNNDFTSFGDQLGSFLTSPPVLIAAGGALGMAGAGSATGSVAGGADAAGNAAWEGLGGLATGASPGAVSGLGATAGVCK